MPSIAELFSTSEIEGEGVDPDTVFDIDALMAGTDRALSESTRLRVPELEGQDGEPEGGDPSEPSASPEPPTTQEGEPTEEEPAEPEAPEAPEPEGEPAQPAGATPDPLGFLTPERRAALLAIDEVVQRDPTKRDAVLRAISESPSQEPQGFVAPPMPESIDPDSNEALLWNQQMDTQRAIYEIGQGTKAQQQAFAQQQAATAAERAGAAFEARYAGKLSHDDVVAIARHAGSTGLAAKFATGASDLTGAYDQALESALWTNEGFRQKALGQGAVPEPPPAERPEAKSRKRKLTALSSAASPTSGGSARKTPLETRTDGRLTPRSRLSVVQEMATKLHRENNEGTY